MPMTCQHRSLGTHLFPLVIRRTVLMLPIPMRAMKMGLGMPTAMRP